MPGSVMAGVGQYPRHSATPVAQTDSRILGYLGRAISLEFSAAQEYLAQAALAQTRQEIELAKRFVALANEEFHHAAILTERLAHLGALPAQSVLKATTPSNSSPEALAACEAREKETIALYAEATAYCTNIGAGDDARFFAQMHEEELAHL
jgi:bacterioferritin